MSLSLVAAPNGARIGFTAAAATDRQVVISVLPKVWRDGRRRIVAPASWPDARRHQRLGLYESDRFHLGQYPPGVEELFDACLAAGTKSSREDYNASKLLAPDVVPRYTDGDRTTEWCDHDELEASDLLMLFQKLHVAFPATQRLTGGRGSSVLYRPLICRRLLDEVFDLVHAARRGYRPVRAVRTVVRGRVESSSAVRYVLTGEPQFACQYDELTESTVLLGVICTGLEIIADGMGPRSPFGPGRFGETNLRHDAVTLRRVMADVQATPAPRARIEGRRLRLSRLDQAWAEALRMTLTLLDDQQHVARAATDRLVDAAELSVSSDALWERIVTEVLKRAGFSNVRTPRDQPAGSTSDPWVVSAGQAMHTRPDNLAHRDGELWVVDAKYKLPSHGMPSRDDQYQMFAYSHLTTLGGKLPRYVLLIYPGVGEPKAFSRGGSASESCGLLTVTLPFPTRRQVRAATSWSAYLDETGNVLSETIDRLTGAIPMGNASRPQ